MQVCRETDMIQNTNFMFTGIHVANMWTEQTLSSCAEITCSYDYH